MTDTDLDRAIHEHLERLVADAPLPPTVDDIVGGRDETARHRRRPALLAGAAALLLLAVGAAVVLSAQSGTHAPPVASGPIRTGPDIVVVMNLDPTDAQVSHVDDLLDDPLVAASTFVEVDEAFDEVVSALLVGPLLEGLEPEAIHASFRVTVVDHDVDAARTLARSLRTAPGVWAVHLDPEPSAVPSLLLPDRDPLDPTPNIIPLDAGQHCPEMYLPGDDNGDGVADTCMRVWDGGG